MRDDDIIELLDNSIALCGEKLANLTPGTDSYTSVITQIERLVKSRTSVRKVQEDAYAASDSITSREKSLLKELEFKEKQAELDRKIDELKSKNDLDLKLKMFERELKFKEAQAELDRRSSKERFEEELRFKETQAEIDREIDKNKAKDEISFKENQAKLDRDSADARLKEELKFKETQADLDRVSAMDRLMGELESKENQSKLDREAAKERLEEELKFKEFERKENLIFDEDRTKKDRVVHIAEYIGVALIGELLHVRNLNAILRESDRQLVEVTNFERDGAYRSRASRKLFDISRLLKF